MRKCKPRGLIQTGERNVYAGTSGKIAVFEHEFHSAFTYFSLRLYPSSTLIPPHHILLTFTPVCSSASNPSRINSDLDFQNPHPIQRVPFIPILHQSPPFHIRQSHEVRLQPASFPTDC